MAILDRLRQELDRAGQSAQRAFDEGRLRLELYRARASVDRFAQRFGYAVYHAKAGGNGDLAAEELTAHMNNMAAAEAEVKRLETLLAQMSEERKNTLFPQRDKPAASPPPQPASPPPPADTAPPDIAL